MSKVSEIIEHIRRELPEGEASALTREDTDMLPEAMIVLVKAMVVSERTKAIQGMSSKHLSQLNRIRAILDEK